MGYHYQKRRLKANKIRRQIASNRAMLLRFRVFLSFLGVCLLLYFCYKVLFVSQWYLNIEKLRKEIKYQNHITEKSLRKEIHRSETLILDEVSRVHHLLDKHKKEERIHLAR